MPVPVKWNRTTARATPPGTAACGTQVDPQDSYVDVAACEALDGPVLTFSTAQWRAFLAQRKTARDTGEN